MHTHTSSNMFTTNTQWLIAYLMFIWFNVYYYFFTFERERERERERKRKRQRVSEGGAAREGDTESEADSRL